MAVGDEARKPRAFFGRRKGHRLRPRRAALLDTLLPRLALDLSAPARELGGLFPHPVDEVRLEIGFGAGEYLVSEARARPRTGFIGIEPFVNGMAKALAAVAAEGLANVRLHPGGASEVLAWLPPASLARVDLVYPDPWPKRRHWKRRFVQDESVAAIARVLRPNGEFRFATDVPAYAAWTLKHLMRSTHFAWTAERADHWRRAWPDFPGTRYEAKAKRAGRVPCYLIFRRTNDR
ncbi:MAG TPA: tRNA (guanosine(46)-N7)-methyltransferase TrmB [Xanthobacteraceae bacterium]|jgi:tRNA (guanine-N7-)-methyltransferase